MLSLAKHKNNELVKKILCKLIKKLTLAYVRSVVPKEHHALIDYVERERRKRINKQKRDKLRALLGQEEKKDDKFHSGAQADDEDSDITSEEEEDQVMQDDDEKSENYSLDSDESESEEEDMRGTDFLMADGIDIPRVDDIPIVSKLAKEQQELQQKNLKAPLKDRLAANRNQVSRFIEAEEDQFESHFVENPFIRMRERTTQKSLNAKTALTKTNMTFDEDKQDIVLIKETGKFLIKDFEAEKEQKKLSKQLKRTRLDAGIQTSSESDTDSDDAPANSVKDKLKELKKKKASGEPTEKRNQPTYGGDSTMKNKRQKKDAVGEGHIVKYSANAYKSEKGQGDVLKAGKYEPFAYIQLNPKMLNKRNKSKAVKSFEGVVSSGKKIDKRSGKKTEGLLSGMGFKKHKKE